MCQIPRKPKTTKYRDFWSYRPGVYYQWMAGIYDQTGCEQTLEFANHKGPMIMDYVLNNLNKKPKIWSQTEEYPDFIPWRISKNLPIYNRTSFY